MLPAQIDLPLEQQCSLDRLTLVRLYRFFREEYTRTTAHAQRVVRARDPSTSH
jgi:hypothetical protein